MARYAARRVPIDDVHVVLSETFLTAWRTWTVLQEMNDEGDWPEVQWAVADAMVNNSSIPAGRPMSVEEGYRSALGCEGG